MSKFIAYVKQGGGCDYTIGCGQAVLELESTTYNEAVEELRREIVDDCYNEDVIEIATLYEIASEHEMPIAEWYSDARKRDRESAASLILKAERLEYDRLKEKFG